MRDQAANKRGVIIVVVLFVIMLAYAVNCAGIPKLLGTTLFKSQSYSSGSTLITAQIDSDTAMNVTEQREFSFSSKTTCLRWKHDDLTSDSTISMRGLRVSVLDEIGNAVESYELTAVPFKAEWRESDGADGIGPGYPCYAIDNLNKTVYTFFEAENATVVFSVDYIVENGLQVWRDIAELNWTFLSGEWPMDSTDISASLQLPVATNAIVSPGKNVNAWSHGPKSGSIEITESGAIRYECPAATAGQWISLHVTFPSVWITNLPDTAIALQSINELHLNASENSEKNWVDSGTAAQIRGDKFDILVLAVALIALIIGVVLFLVHGRDHRPKGLDAESARNAVSSLHPALLGRLMRWNRQSESDFVSSVVHLVQQGAIEAEWSNDDIRLTRTESAPDNELDNAAIEALFTRLAKGAKSITLADIERLARIEGDLFCETMASWNHALDHSVTEAALFDKKSFSLQIRLFLLAAFLLVIGIVAKLCAGSDVLFATSLPVACIIALLANYAPRRTQAGEDLAASIELVKGEPSSEGKDGTDAPGGDEAALELVALQLRTEKENRASTPKESSATANLYKVLSAAITPASNN